MKSREENINFQFLNLFGLALHRKSDSFGFLFFKENFLVQQAGTIIFDSPPFITITAILINWWGLV